MKCHEARNLLGPYLDSELDIRTSHDIEQHLQWCPDCERVFDAETRLEGRIKETLCGGPFTPALWHAAEAAVLRRHRFGARWPALGWGLAAAATAAVAVWLSVARPGAGALDLAIASERCHRHSLSRHATAEPGGAVPDDLSRASGGRLDSSAFAFAPSQPAFHSRTSRFCLVGGTPAALTVGDCDGVLVSLIVFRHTELDRFPVTKGKLESGHPVVCSRAGRFHFAARLVDGHVVCVIGETSMAALEDLLNSVNKKT